MKNFIAPTSRKLTSANADLQALAAEMVRLEREVEIRKEIENEASKRIDRRVPTPLSDSWFCSRMLNYLVTWASGDTPKDANYRDIATAIMDHVRHDLIAGVYQPAHWLNMANQMGNQMTALHQRKGR